MSMIYSTLRTPRGAEVVKVIAAGSVDFDDAQELTRQLAPGGKYGRHAILGLVDPRADFSAAARQALVVDTRSDPQPKPTAIVVTSAPLRVMLSFIVRLTGSVSSTRFFPAEAPALAWLDEAPASGAASSGALEA